MKGAIYNAYERSGEATIKSKIRDLTFQILKNAIASTKLLTNLHSELLNKNGQEPTSQHQIIEELTHYRNDTAAMNFENHKNLLESLARIQTRIGSMPNMVSTAQEINKLGEEVRDDWNSAGVNPVF